MEDRKLTQREAGSGGEPYRSPAELVGQIRSAVQDGDQAQLVRLLEPLHEADIADILEQVDPELRRDAVALWGRHFDSDVLSELDEPIQQELV